MSFGKDLEDLKQYMIETDKMINEFSDDELHPVLRRIHSAMHRMRYMLQKNTEKKRKWVEFKKRQKEKQDGKVN